MCWRLGSTLEKIHSRSILLLLPPRVSFVIGPTSHQISEFSWEKWGPLAQHFLPGKNTAAAIISTLCTAQNLSELKVLLCWVALQGILFCKLIPLTCEPKSTFSSWFPAARSSIPGCPLHAIDLAASSGKKIPSASSCTALLNPTQQFVPCLKLMRPRLNCHKMMGRKMPPPALRA